MAELTTLCYLQKDHKYLMMHRTVKKNDVNHDKWIGVGGHIEENESPEEGLLREVREETGLTLTSWKMRGIVTFLSGLGDYEFMFLYTADGWQQADGSDISAEDLNGMNDGEGILEWVDMDQIEQLNIWEGDKIFFRLIDEDAPFFSLKLVYDGKDHLVEAVLDGKKNLM